MSENGEGNLGVGKLIEYLNTTRRQAELSINILNEKITELTTETNELQLALDEVTTEKDYYANLVETMQKENTNKSRLQERDDWKCLVESVQSDRTRLQEECNNLAEQLEKMHEQLRMYQQRELQLTSNHRELEEESKEVPNHQGIMLPPDSPSSSTVRRLRNEVEELKTQLDQQNKSSMDEINHLNLEIAKLQDELTHYKRHSTNVPHYVPSPDMAQNFNHQIKPPKPLKLVNRDQIRSSGPQSSAITLRSKSWTDSYGLQFLSSMFTGPKPKSRIYNHRSKSRTATVDSSSEELDVLHV